MTKMTAKKNKDKEQSDQELGKRVVGIESKWLEGTQLKNKTIFQGVPRSIIGGAGSDCSDLNIKDATVAFAVEVTGHRCRCSVFNGMKMVAEAVAQS